MKLFEVKQKDQLGVLVNNLEKISKIAAIRVQKDYTDAVIEDLKWIEDSFIKILQLYNSNKPLFFKLIDPHNRYRITLSEPIDWENHPFSGFAEIQQVDETQPQPRSYEKLYKVYDNPQNEKDLILRYISSIFDIWNAANQKENFLVQKYSLYVLTNWIYILDSLKDNDFNYQAILRYFLDNLTNLNVSTLNTDDQKIQPLSSLLSYNIYLNRIISDEANKDNIDLYFEFLFRNLYQALRLQNTAIVKAFIERCIDSSFYPSNTSSYTSLYSLLLDKLRAHNEQADHAAILKPLPQLAGFAIRYINDFVQLDKWNESFDGYLNGHIFNRIEPDAAIRRQIAQIKRLALNTLKFNKLQIVVIKLLAYSLFKSDLSLLNHALEYNQPGDSNAFQGNKEILPTSLLELLNIIKHRYIIEHELFPYWEGHHGVEFYLDQLFMILLYRYRPRKMYYDENAKQTAIGFSRDALNEDPGAIDGTDQYIIRLSTMFDKLTELEPYKANYFSNADKVARTKQLFSDIHEGFASVMGNLEVTGNIKERTKNGFIESIIAEYRKYNFLLKLYQKYGTDPKFAENLNYETVGVNELIERTAFVENWHIPYVGFIEGRGREVADQENRNGQFEIIKKIVPENRIKIGLNEVADIFDKYSDGNYVVIVRNLHLDSLLRSDEKYKANWKNKDPQILIPDFHVGNYGDLPVFRLFDHLFHDSLLVLEKAAFVTASVQTGAIAPPFELNNDFKAAFIDLGTGGQYFDEMIAQPPIWVAEDFKGRENELTQYLQKKVWLRILKKTAFFVAPDTKMFLYEIK